MRGAQTAARACAIALGVSIPISTALDNLLLALLALAWALSGLLPRSLCLARRHAALGVPPLLFALLAAGVAYGATPWREALSVLGKYDDLLFIPVFAAVMADARTRQRALLAYAAAIALTVLLSWALWLKWVPAWPFFVWDQVSPSVFKYKATHNILVAFGAYVFLWLGAAARSTRGRAVAYGFAVLAAGDVLLLVNGATGYAMLAALLLLHATLRLRGRHVALGVAAVMGLGAVLAVAPGPLHDRLRVTLEDIGGWHAGTAASDTRSSALRMEAYYNTAELVAAHPLAGVGTGGFTRAYAARVAGTQQSHTTNPHNEFLGLAVQLGVGGALLLLCMLGLQWRSAWRAPPSPLRSLALGLVVAMALGCAVSSMLLDHTEGLLYAWFCGLLFGGIVEKGPTTERTQGVG